MGTATKESKKSIPVVGRLFHDEKGYFSPSQGAVIPVEHPTFQDLEIPRKFFHMFGSIIAWIYLLSGMSHQTALTILAGYTATILGLDILRLLLPSLNKTYTARFSKLIRSSEHNTLNTSTFFMLGALTVVAFFPKTIAVVAIFYLAFGDPMAAIIGMRFGRTSVFGKSVEGSMGCFVTCLIIGLFFFDWPIAVFGAFVATLSELIPLPLNDNFRIPVISALALLLVV